MSNIAPPHISVLNDAPPFPGAVLVCTQGTYHGNPTLSHKWRKQFQPIPGETNPEGYTIKVADIGFPIDIEEYAVYPEDSDIRPETQITPRHGPPVAQSPPLIRVAGGGNNSVPCTLEIEAPAVWENLQGQSGTSHWEKDPGASIGSGGSLQVGEPGSYRFVESYLHEGVEVISASDPIGVSA